MSSVYKLKYTEWIEFLLLEAMHLPNAIMLIKHSSYMFVCKIKVQSNYILKCWTFMVAIILACVVSRWVNQNYSNIADQ